MSKEDLLNKFNKTESSTIISKESTKNNQEDEAKTKRNVSQINNQTEIGTFAVKWVINTISIVSILLLAMSCVYIFNISLEQDKLEDFLKFVYSELTMFFNKYQAVLAAIAAFMFGDTIKGKGKK
jgi:hypothetical protein